MLGELRWHLEAARYPRELPAAARGAFQRRLLRYVAGPCQFVRGPLETVARQRFDMHRVARETRGCDLDAATERERSDALSGADLCRHKCFWKLTIPRAPVGVLRSLKEAVERWLPRHAPRVRLGPDGRRDRRPMALLNARPIDTIVGPALATPPPILSPEFMSYCRQVPRRSEDLTIVIEDKDTAAAWTASRIGYRLGDIPLPPSRWGVTEDRHDS